MGEGGFRRTKRVAAMAAVGVAATAALASPGGAQEDFNPGRGQAIAQAYRLNPKAGGLSLGITFGQALAGHQNTVGRAESQVVDLGIIGDTLAGEGCDGGEATFSKDQLPAPTSVDSREDGAEQGRTSPQDAEYGLGTESVKASAAPSSEAVTDILPAEVPGVVAIGGGRTITRSGVVDGNVREAVAITELDRLDLGGGQVVLAGLRWEAIHRTGAKEEMIGRFTIGSATIAGQPVAAPEQDPAEVLAAVNDALKPLGLVVRPPRVYDAKGIQFVDPISIGVVPAAERDSVVGPVVGAAQPVREELFGTLLEQSCSFASPILVFDIVFGAFTGAGGLTLELGGVQANTAAIAYSSALGGLPQGSLGGSLGQGSLASGGGSFSAPGASLGGTTGAAPGAADAGGSNGGGAPVAAVPASSTTDGARGGALAAVGAVGLAGIALTAEADRRRMRRAARTILTEA